MEKPRRMKDRTSLIKQIYFVTLIAMALIAVETYAVQFGLAISSKRTDSALYSAEVAEEVVAAVKEYPAHAWLLKYWYEHHDDLEIEYDAQFGSGTKTEEQCRLLAAHQPDLQIRYAEEEAIKALPEEDQKLYAEIAYSWLNTRINEIKRCNQVDYLYCVLTDTEDGEHPYESMFYLLSGAEKDSVRGSGYGEVYPLGTVITTAEDSGIRKAMKSAAEDNGTNPEGNYDYTGNYADYFSLIGSFEDHAVLVAVSYKIDSIKSDIRADAAFGTFHSVILEFLLVQLMMWNLIRYGIRPLEGILETIRKYTESKNSAEVREKLTGILSAKGSAAVRKNEIGQLAEDFMDLTDEIDHYVHDIETITKENERILADLELAAKIQTSMLPGDFPAFPERKEFDIYATMDPAREVGGDFYDFFLIDDDHLCLVVADVSGKGIPGALFMMISKVIIQNCAYYRRTPAEIMEMANNLLYANNREEMFVTVWLGILEISTGILTTVNAGHECPAVAEADGTFSLIRDKHGVMAGIMENMKYRNETLQLKPNGKVFQYSDGLPEAMSEEEELFGTDRIINALNQDPSLSPKEIIANVQSAVDDFVKDAEQFDDLTMMCIQYFGPNREKESSLPEQE